MQDLTTWHRSSMGQPPISHHMPILYPHCQQERGNPSHALVSASKRILETDSMVGTRVGPSSGGSMSGDSVAPTDIRAERSSGSNSSAIDVGGAGRMQVNGKSASTSWTSGKIPPSGGGKQDQDLEGAAMGQVQRGLTVGRQGSSSRNNSVSSLSSTSKSSSTQRHCPIS
ncbi:unnamed protein product [Discosporangium mesarthrocarpum]